MGIKTRETEKRGKKWKLWKTFERGRKTCDRNLFVLLWQEFVCFVVNSKEDRERGKEKTLIVFVNIYGGDARVL